MLRRTGDGTGGVATPITAPVPAPVPAPAPRSLDPRFAEAIREHEAALGTLASRLCRNRSDASDLVQDAFERALRAWPRLSDRSNVRAWLVTILHRLFLDRCRRARRGIAVPFDDHGGGACDASALLPGDEPPIPPAWTQVTPAQLRRAIDRLDGDFRRVYELAAVERASYREIAERLRIPAPTVGTRLLRARRKLKALLLEELAAAPAEEPR